MNSLIPVAHAATQAQITAQCFVDKINDAILFPLITLMMALAFLFFLYGVFEYVKNAANESARETGRNHLVYGVIGMLIMLSAFSILNIAAGTFGLGMFDSDSVGCSDIATETSSPRGGGSSDGVVFGTGAGFDDNSRAPYTGDRIERSGLGGGELPVFDTPDAPFVQKNPVVGAAPYISSLDEDQLSSYDSYVQNTDGVESDAAAQEYGLLTYFIIPADTSGSFPVLPPEYSDSEEICEETGGSFDICQRSSYVCHAS